MNRDMQKEEDSMDQGSYSWQGVISFIISKSRENEIKESEWQLEKRELEQRNAELAGRLSAQETLNEDLMKRIKMLEYALKRERVKFVALLNKSGHEDREKLLDELRKEEQLPVEVEKILKEKKPELELPKRRAKKTKEFISRILKQFDCEDILDEVAPALNRDSNIELENELMSSFENSDQIESQGQSGVDGSVVNLAGSRNSNKVNTFAKKQTPYIDGPEHERAQTSNKATLDEYWSLMAHLDSVRDIALFGEDRFIATCGDDCVVRVTSMAEIKKRKQSENFIVGRQDMFPVFCVTGRGSLVTSGGVEGIVRLWNLEDEELIELESSLQLENVVWDVEIHPKENLLLTSSADGVLKGWELYQDESGSIAFTDIDEGLDFDLSGTGTSIAFSAVNNRTFFAGIHNQSKLLYFDLDASSPMSSFTYKGSVNSQVNRIATNEYIGDIAVTACDEGYIRVFDSRTKKIVKEWSAHKYSCSAVDLTNDGIHVASTGHDGFLKLWDLRNETLYAERKCHQKKMDEIITNVKILGKENIVLTSGADGELIFHKIV